MLSWTGGGGYHLATLEWFSFAKIGKPGSLREAMASFPPISATYVIM